MIRTYVSALAVTAALLAPTGAAFAADAPTATGSPVTTKAHPNKCVGATEHRQAMDLRVQAINLDLSALQQRRTNAMNAGDAAQVAKIDARIAKLNARLAEIAARKAKLNERCPA